MFDKLGYWFCYPFAVAVKFLNDLTGSYAIAIIMFALLVKLVTYPFMRKSRLASMRLSMIRPTIKRIETQFDGNRVLKEKYLTELYERYKAAPGIGCIWSIIPYPIFVALFGIMREPMRYMLRMPIDAINNVMEIAKNSGFQLEKGQSAVYSQIYLLNYAYQNPQVLSDTQGITGLNLKFLGLDLSSVPLEAFYHMNEGFAKWSFILLPFIIVALRVASLLISRKRNGGKMSLQSIMISAFFILSIFTSSFVVPSTLCLYWVCVSLLSIADQLISIKTQPKTIEKLKQEAIALGYDTETHMAIKLPEWDESEEENI